MAKERKQIDWEKVEEAYKAGVLSLREMSAEFGCAESYIRRKAKENGWERDLTQKIEREVRTKIVRSDVRTSDEVKRSEREIVEANAQAILDIRLSHRGDIRKAKGIVAKLFDEVENAALVEGKEPPAEILSIPQRVDCVRKLTDSAKTLIALEREAWDIASDADKQVGGVTVVISDIDSRI